MEKIEKSDAAWRAQLTPEQYRICRQGGTEPPFSAPEAGDGRGGVYRCSCCGAPLFASAQKYDSGSGWPSFWAPVDPQALERRVDQSHGLQRVEVRCARCDAHLGHRFPDGPPPTGQRYCINSVCLRLDPEGDQSNS